MSAIDPNADAALTTRLNEQLAAAQARIAELEGATHRLRLALDRIAAEYENNCFCESCVLSLVAKKALEATR